MANPRSLMSRIRVLAIALLAVVAVAACEGTPTETTQTSIDTAVAVTHVDRV